MRHFREDMRRQLEEKSTKLINAARDGDFETVKSVVESAEISIDTVDRITGETAFSAALATGRRRVCEYLLANDAHLYAPCIVNETSLSVLSTAAAMWDVDFVKRVLSRGAMLTMPTGSEIDMLTCPLAEAAKSGSTQIVDALLELGARVAPHRQGLSLPWPAYAAFDFSSSNLDDETPWRLLAIACWQQDLTMIEHLFETQAALRDRSMLAKHGAHALFLAVHQENQGIVADLLARGVSVNESIGRDMTALVAAVAVNSLKMLHLLLDNGADASVVHTSVQSTTGFAEGLLSTAVYAGAMDCAHELLRMETRPQYFDQALHGAAKRGDVDFARLLLDIALPSTPRALAVTISRTSCPLMLDLLLSRCGEVVDFTALNNYFPYACRTYGAGIVSVLIAYGVDINLDNAWEEYPPLLGAILPMRFLYGRTLLSRVEANLRDRTRACLREFYEAGRDLLISHGILK